MKFTEPFEFWTDYDHEADVLYISFERPQKATDSKLRDDGVLLRYRGKQYERAELVRKVAEARQAHQQGNVQRGTSADLMRELDQPAVVETSRGLSIAGTRITLYDIMDYLTANWPPELIRDWFNLTDQQITDVIAYIETHRAQVEAEYQLVLQQIEATRHYWETRNQERFAQIASMPPKPGQEEI